MTEIERRHDYPELVETKFKVDALIERVEHLERVADNFENLARDIAWVKRISQGIGAIAVFLFGESLKKKIGL